MQVAEARRSDAAEAGSGGDRGEPAGRPQAEPEAEATGTLASDEALAALRDKLSGGQS